MGSKRRYLVKRCAIALELVFSNILIVLEGKGLDLRVKGY